MMLQVQEPECSFSEDDFVLGACRAVLSKFKTVDADSLEYSTLSQELICGGWLTEHYRRCAPRLDCQSLPEHTRCCSLICS